MQDNGFIHKIVITKEAEFDYEESLELEQMPKRDIKTELEDYIALREHEYLHKHYLRLKYLDEYSGKMLMLFVFKGDSFSKMHLWKLKGICFEEDWCEMLEDNSQIRNWYETKTVDLPNELDLVESYNLLKEEQQKLMEEYENE